MSPISISPLAVTGEVEAGADVAALLLAAIDVYGIAPSAHDVLVVAQKIISKAEDHTVDLNTVNPSPRALELAATTGKDARLVEVILSESAAVVRAAPHVLIVRHRCGFVMANAGIDRSNVPSPEGEKRVLLPRDADASAAKLRADITKLCGVEIGVVIADSFGRP